MPILMIWNDIPICGLITNKVSIIRKDFFLLTNQIKIEENIVSKYFHKAPGIISFDHDIESQISLLNTNFIFVPGWSFQNINKYISLKKNANFRVILLSDNNFQLTLRKILGAVYFRLFLRSYYCGVLVPGVSGEKLMRFYGFNKAHIFRGMYGASEEIFYPTTTINQRPKKFLFVGQLISRKSIKQIVQAYHNYLSQGGTWGLTIVGSGYLKNELNLTNIEYLGSKNPEEVAKIMNDSSCLILVSKVEHWGTVVVEGMACGLPLLISKNVGSYGDLFCENGVSLNKPSIKQIYNAMLQFEFLSPQQLNHMSELSIERATGFNSNSYYNNLELIIKSRGLD